MAQAVDWDVARTVAKRFSKKDTFSSSYHYESLHRDFEELTELAQELVEAHLGWTSLSGQAVAKVVTRDDWVDANVKSFNRMLRPVLKRFEEHASDNVVSKVSSKFAGAEMGSILGWMSSRVLGQYDLLILEEEDVSEQDIVYYVGPNILSLEKRFGFPSREFRLWIALHEVTHRTQFTAKPWIKEYFLAQTATLMSLADPDPNRLFDAIGRVAESIQNKKNPLDEGGIAAVFASEEQRAAMKRVGGLMSLLEGHGDVTMDRAGGDHVPSAERFSRVLKERRESRSGVAKMVQKLIGLDAKLAQYAQGEAFIEQVENTGGNDLLERAFSTPEFMPTQDEIVEPTLWIARMDREPAASR